MEKRNYKEDLDFIMRLRDCRGEDVGWPSWDWEAKFYTTLKPNACTASHKDGVLTNCFNDDGRIHIVLNDHRLSKGILHVDFTAKIPSGIYPDGVKDKVVVMPLDIELVGETGDCSCPGTAEVEVMLDFAVVSAYETACKEGFSGTQEEYYAGLGMLPDLATLTSDLRQGKREIAAALTAQGVPTQADAPMAEMAEGVRSLYAVPDVDAGSRDRAIRSGVYSHYDMVNEVNRHRRADYPYVCGCSFLGREVTLAGADATLLSDGTWIVGAEETSHVFDDDGMSAHYAIFYFKEDFYSFPWPQGVTVGDIAALDSHPCFSPSSAKPFVSLFVDAEPADYDGHDFSVGPHGSVVSMGGIMELASGSTVASEGTIQVVELPDLKTTRRAIASYCNSLMTVSLPNLAISSAGNLVNHCSGITKIELPRLTNFIRTLFWLCDNLTIVRLQSVEKMELTEIYSEIICDCKNIKELHLDSLIEFYGGSNNAFVRGSSPTMSIYAPKLERMTGSANFAYDMSNGIIDIFVPSLLKNAAPFFNCGGNFKSRFHLGSQKDAQLNLNHSSVMEISILPGFTGTLVFPSADLTVENLRDIIANLGDNTAGATYRLQMGTANMAKLTEDEIAVATAKNYTVS